MTHFMINMFKIMGSFRVRDYIGIFGSGLTISQD
jgi:hypothetical protein